MSTTPKQFIDAFSIKDGFLSVAVGDIRNVKYLKGIREDNPLPTDMDVFFAPARRKKNSDAKEDVLGTIALWVDIDNPRLPRATLPPSALVFSGHGWHMYWFLKQPLMSTDRIETLNKVLIKDVTGADPACWNANRFLRVPDTINSKNGETLNVELRQFDIALRYDIEDFEVLNRLDKKTRHKIRTGDQRGYSTRSERDWAVVKRLVQEGASDALIYILFNRQRVGNKHQDPQTSAQYLEHTIQNARKQTVKKDKQEPGTVIAKKNGYHLPSRGGLRRISTFTIEPTMLLDGSPFGAQDAIVGTVVSNNYEWPEQTFTKGAFTTVRSMDKECPVAAWQWLGNELDLRKLLPFLMDNLLEQGLPRVLATPTMGMHFGEDDQAYFLGDYVTLGADEAWEGYTGPLAWLPSKKEHPEMALTDEISKEQLKWLGSVLPTLNKPEVIWPMIGWYSAACMKPWLERQNYRFPVLNVTGSRGSGKTTLIQRVFMPLFGQKNPKSYDAGTTRFVKLALLGSTNAVPIAFSEFRYEKVADFVRYILLAYDTGHDPRGRADQTTVDYPLSAPFSVDGEDVITDAAAKQRIVVVRLRPATIDEGSSPHRQFNEFRDRPLTGFGRFHITYALKAIQTGEAEELLERSRNALMKEFPQKIPDRIRNNLTVALFGANMWCDIVGRKRPNPNVFAHSLKEVYNVEAGRGRLLIDDMVEDVVNACAAATDRFAWEYESSTDILFFQVGTAHPWWAARRRYSGGAILERPSLISQMKEVEYSVEPKVISGTYMYGIDLKKAQDAGLDIPDSIKVNEVRMRF